jgi:hypothetical protein
MINGNNSTFVSFTTSRRLNLTCNCTCAKVSGFYPEDSQFEYGPEHKPPCLRFLFVVLSHSNPVFLSLSDSRHRLGQYLCLTNPKVRNKDRHKKNINRHNKSEILMT